MKASTIRKTYNLEHCENLDKPEARLVAGCVEEETEDMEAHGPGSVVVILAGEINHWRETNGTHH
jgi:hypothetical protein